MRRVVRYFIVPLLMFGMLFGNEILVKADTALIETGDAGCEISIKLDGQNPVSLQAGEKYVMTVYFSKVEAADTIFFNVKYDDTILEVLPDETEGLNNWEVTFNNMAGQLLVSMDGSADSSDVNTSIMNVAFKVKQDAASTDIQLVDVNPAYLGEDLYTNGASNQLTLGANSSSTKKVELYMEDMSIISQDVVVPIKIGANTGFDALGLTITYDNQILTYDSIEIAEPIVTKLTQSVYAMPENGMIKASFINTENITDTGDFLKLKFKLSDTVVTGTSTEVAVSITQVENEAEEEMVGQGAHSIVTVESINEGGGDESGDSGNDENEDKNIIGDVNGDQKIDLLDAVYALQAYNGVRNLSGTQEIAADVNASGRVELVDVLLILKYYNGEISTFRAS